MSWHCFRLIWIDVVITLFNTVNIAEYKMKFEMKFQDPEDESKLSRIREFLATLICQPWQVQEQLIINFQIKVQTCSIAL